MPITFDKKGGLEPEFVPDKSIVRYSSNNKIMIPSNQQELQSTSDKVQRINRHRKARRRLRQRRRKKLRNGERLGVPRAIKRRRNRQRRRRRPARKYSDRRVFNYWDHPTNL